MQLLEDNMVEKPSLKQHLFSNSQPIYNFFTELSKSTETLPSKVKNGWNSYRKTALNLASEINFEKHKRIKEE